MTVALPPFGHLATTHVAPGNTADDVLSLSSMARTRVLLTWGYSLSVMRRWRRAPRAVKSRTTAITF